MQQRHFPSGSLAFLADALLHARAAADIAVVAGIVSTTYTVGGADPESVMAQRVSASLWQVPDVHPVLGRSFTEQEDLPSADRVALIGHGVWQRRFGSDPTVIGRSIVLDDVPHTVVGILPKGFRGVLPRDSTGHSPILPKKSGADRQ
jgi:hypothetical protein